MENYWQLIKWDGETIKVRPASVQAVQQQLDRGEGFIKGTTRTIAVKDIKEFLESDERYIDQKLIGEAARAFNEPVTFERDNGKGITETVVKAKWVKKPVPRKQWERFYSLNGYKRISETDNHILAAFRVAIHNINYNFVEDCTPSEVSLLEG